MPKSYFFKRVKAPVYTLDTKSSPNDHKADSPSGELPATPAPSPSIEAGKDSISCCNIASSAKAESKDEGKACCLIM